MKGSVRIYPNLSLRGAAYREGCHGGSRRCGVHIPLAGMLPSRDDPASASSPPREAVKAYQRRTRFSTTPDAPDQVTFRFDAAVLVKVIELPNPELVGLAPEAYEGSGEKVTHRLAQQPGAYVVLKYVRKVIKLKETEQVSCSPASPAVLEKSLADVSVLAGVLIDKFDYHRVTRRQLNPSDGEEEVMLH